MKTKCTPHVFGPDGRCQKCHKRRRGRPVNSKPAPAEPKADALPAAMPSLRPELPRAGDSQAARTARLQSLFAPPPPIVVAPSEPEPEPEPAPAPEPEPEPVENTIPIARHDWKWAAAIATEAVDVGSGWAIGAWTDLQPLEASEASRKRFAETLGTFGAQRLGDLEVPTWIVLVICLVALIASKVIGAPKKETRTVPTVPPVGAPTVDASPPDVATDAGKHVTLPLPLPPPPLKQPIVDDAGSVQNVQVGF